MKNENIEGLLVFLFIGVVLVNITSYFGHQKEMKAIRNLERQIEYKLEEIHPESESLLDKLEEVRELQ